MDHSPNIRIFISAHKESEFPTQSQIFQPVHVGSALTNTSIAGTIRDDSGDNISSLNPSFCELTAQYWAWKNAEAEYYGFCHYRRYFDFSTTLHKENDYGEIIDSYINERTISEYALEDTAIINSVHGWDVMTTPLNSVKKMGGFSNLKEHWNADSHLLLSDLKAMYDILLSQHPEYREDADAVLNGFQAAFCNMFIMRKDIFHAYCEWLFPLLFEFSKRIDMTNADEQRMRTAGHLSERLLNIFIHHHQRVENTWKIKRLPCVHFTHPEPLPHLTPLPDAPRDIIPVVFAADNNYAPMLASTLESLVSHADKEKYFDLIVLHRDITSQNQDFLAHSVHKHPYANIRFYNVSHLVDGYQLSTNNQHISVETYYRFLIQEVLPFYKKILYLDCDLIVENDVSELYSTQLGSTLIGAVYDLDFLGNYHMKDGKRKKYAKDVLHLHNPLGYFQAGVLVMNLEELRKLHTVEEWLTIAQNPSYIYNDQDILNMECEGRVTYLDPSWNVMHDCAGRVAGVFAYAPRDIYRSYLNARSHPRIVHFAGFDKPWVNPWCDYAPLYWKYAQRTPFAAQIIGMLSGKTPPPPAEHHERALSENSALRKYVDVLAPNGSKQRELIKVTVRKIRKLR